MLTNALFLNKAARKILSCSDSVSGDNNKHGVWPIPTVSTVEAS